MGDTRTDVTKTDDQGQNGDQGRDASKDTEGQGKNGQQGDGKNSGGDGKGGGSSSTTDDADNLRKALDRERELRKDAEKKARENASYKARAEELEAAGQSDTEKAVAQARKDVTAEVTKQANQRLVHAEARALAAEADFRSPMSAVKLLDLSEVSVTDAGVVDAAAIKSALEALAKDEPYLLKTEDGKPRPPKQDHSQGSGRDAQVKPGQRGLDEAKRRYGDRTQAATT